MKIILLVSLSTEHMIFTLNLCAMQHISFLCLTGSHTLQQCPMHHVDISCHNSLNVEVILNTVLASFAAHSRVFHSSESRKESHVSMKACQHKKEANLRSSSVRHDASVDCYHAEVEELCDASDTVDVLCKDVRSQTDVTLVGNIDDLVLVVETEDGR